MKNLEKTVWIIETFLMVIGIIFFNWLLIPVNNEENVYVALTAQQLFGIVGVFIFGLIYSAVIIVVNAHYFPSDGTDVIINGDKAQ
jgi:hypothetical protein